MGLLCKRRNLVGNIALVMFLTFLATITFGSITPGVASADTEYAMLGGDSKAVVDEGETKIDVVINLKPVTVEDFDNLVVKLFYGAVGGTQIAEINKSLFTATDVGEGVYKVVYSFVYDALTVDKQIYLVVYSTVYQDGLLLDSITITKRDKPPEDTGGGGAPAPKPETTEVDLGTVETTKAESKLAVDATAGLDLVEKAAASDKAVTFTISKDLVRDNNTIAVPNEVLTAALAGDKPVTVAVEVAGAKLAIEPGAIDMDEFKGEDVSFEFVVNRKDADKNSDLAGVADFRLAGDVYEFSIRVTDKDGNDLGRISNFAAGKVTLVLAYDAELVASQGIDANCLRAFRLNNSGGWDKVGGTVDTANSTITVARDSLSKYTVMTNTFADVTKHWAKDDIELMVTKGVVKGMTDDAFAPDQGITRAEFAALLVRSLDLDQSASYKGVFTDVAGDSWYWDVVEAAVAAGIVNGYEDGTFKPDADITREQMASMVVRAIASTGKDVAVTGEEVDALLAGFADASSVSDWAVESVAVAVDVGIIGGRTADTIVPGDGATRAESVTMIKRLLAYLEML